jgi:hypothetical protein
MILLSVLYVHKICAYIQIQQTVVYIYCTSIGFCDLAALCLDPICIESYLLMLVAESIIELVGFYK